MTTEDSTMPIGKKQSLYDLEYNDINK
jgi:hypothetical protein